MGNYGTRVFFGLDSQSSQNMLEDGELTVAKNVNYDTHGGVRAEKVDLLASNAAADDISGIGMGTLGGVVTHFYKSGTSVYSFVGNEIATAIPGTWGAGQLRVYQGDNAVVLTDGANVRVWDGQVLRKLGPPPEGTSFDAYESEVLTSFPVNSVTDQIIDNGVRIQGIESAHAGYHAWLTGGATYDSYDDLGIMYMVVYMHSPGGGLPAAGSPTAYMSDGDYLYVDQNVQMPRLKGKHVRFRFFLPGSTDPIPQPADPNFYRFRVEEFTIEDDEWPYSSSWQWPQNVGNEVWMYPRGCGLDGQYGYGVSYTIKLPDEKVLESDLEALMFPSGQEFAALTLATEVRARVRRWTQDDIDSYILHPGPSYDPAVTIRLHRTKEGGPSYYELHEYEEPDSIQPAPETPPLIYRDRKKDGELGAAYLPLAGTREAPPAFRDAVVSGNRLYAISEADRRQLHFSFLGDLDYWNPLDYVQFPESLTGVSSMPGFVAAFSATRCWLYDNDDGIGYMVQIPVQIGVDSHDALVSLGGNVYAGNDVGLWELSGSRVRLVSLPVETQWREAGTGSWAGGVVGSKMIWTPKVGDAFVVKISEDGIRWGVTEHPEDNNYEVFVGDASRNRMFCQMQSGAYFFGAGTAEKEMEIASKQYGVGLLGRCSRLSVDVSYDIEGWLWVVSNYHEDPAAIRIMSKRGSRHVQEFNLPDMQGEFWTLKYVGTGALYGWSVEVKERDTAY